MEFTNSYADPERAAAYATLEFPGTYYLAFRDLPAIFNEYVTGTAALDFGCGAGRSTRFLRRQGFQPTGVDISPEMIAVAQQRDPAGQYLVVPDGDLSAVPLNNYDLVLAAFTFDNIPGVDHRIDLLRQLRQRLRRDGALVLVDSTPELYRHEWASFSTSATFPQNATAKSGDDVFTMMLDVPDRRPVHDILWTDDDYEHQFHEAGLDIDDTYLPLGRADEPYAWVNETSIAPWVIYVTSPRL